MEPLLIILTSEDNRVHVWRAALNLTAQRAQSLYCLLSADEHRKPETYCPYAYPAAGRHETGIRYCGGFSGAFIALAVTALGCFPHQVGHAGPHLFQAGTDRKEVSSLFYI